MGRFLEREGETMDLIYHQVFIHLLVVIMSHYPVSVGRMGITIYWNDPMDQYTTTKPKEELQQPMECTVHPGDAMFGPHGWWHMVINFG